MMMKHNRNVLNVTTRVKNAMDLGINNVSLAQNNNSAKIFPSIIKVVHVKLIITMMETLYADNVIQAVSCVMEKERAIALAAVKMRIDLINREH